MTIHVTLRPDLEAFVQTLVASGRYGSAEEVVAAAIEELAQTQAEAADPNAGYTTEELRALIDEADAEDKWVDSKEVFARLRERISKL